MRYETVSSTVLGFSQPDLSILGEREEPDFCVPQHGRLSGEAGLRIYL